MSAGTAPVPSPHLPPPGHTFAGIPENTPRGDALQGESSVSRCQGRGTGREREGRQGWLTRGSSLWAKVSCTGSCSPEMLLSPTVMPTTVLSKT